MEKIQRYSDCLRGMRYSNHGDYVLYADHLERVQVLRAALEALGAMPDGYCFCRAFRDPDKENHSGECAQARAALKEVPDGE